MRNKVIKNWELLFKAVRNIRDNHSVYEAFKTLSPREKEILSMRFGLKDGVTHHLEEVGEEFGVTRERIRQIETKVLEKISNYWKVLQWTGYSGEYEEINSKETKPLSNSEFSEYFLTMLDQTVEKVILYVPEKFSPSDSVFWQKMEKRFNEEYDKKFPTRLINTYKIDSAIYCSDCNTKLSPIYGWDKLKTFIREEGFLPFWENGIKEGYGYGFYRGYELGKQKGRRERLDND